MSAGLSVSHSLQSRPLAQTQYLHALKDEAALV